MICSHSGRGQHKPGPNEQPGSYSESLEKTLCLISKFFNADQGWKIRIRDGKIRIGHPGTATQLE